MRTEEEERRLVRLETGKSVVQVWIIWIISICGSYSYLCVMSSVVGAILLAWWELQYHQSNSQLWMVPIGLILFATPAVVWFSVFASGIHRSSSLRIDQRVRVLSTFPDDSVHDPER